MNDNNAADRFTLDVQPGTKLGTFGWAIRDRGKLLQRSDRLFRAEAEARRNGQLELERHLAESAGLPTKGR